MTSGLINTIVDWITPPEVDVIVEKLRQTSREIEDIVYSLKSSKDQLALSWQGGQIREDVIGRIDEKIDRLEKTAADLENKAHQISMITVRVVVTEEIKDILGY